MKLPSLLDLRRRGNTALKSVLDPSAVERGLQYLRDGGFVGLNENHSHTFALQGDFQEKTLTRIEWTSPSQPAYSSCDCTHSQHGIFCKHQAALSWVFAIISTKSFDGLSRVSEEVLASLEFLKDYLPDSTKTLVSPQSKTHVTTGQDATPHKEARFLGLYLCLPEFEQFSSEDQAPSPLFPELTQPQPRIQSFTMEPTPIFVRDSDLAHPLWRSPLLSKSSIQVFLDHPSERLRRELIHYVFDDGTVLSAPEILFHPYAKNVPHDLYPVKLHSEELEKLSPWVGFKDSGFDARASDHLNFVLSKILKETEKLLSFSKIRVWAGTWTQLQSQRGIEIKKLQNASESQLFTLSCREDFHPVLTLNGENTLASESNHDQELRGDHTFFNPKEKSLKFHLLKRYLEKFSETTDLMGVNVTEKFFETFQGDLGYQISQIQFKPELKMTRGESWEKSIYFQQNGSFLPALRNEEGVLVGWPYRVFKVFQALNEGIRKWDPTLADPILEAKKGMKRALDPRVLKHPGIALLLFSETLRNPYQIDTIKTKLAQFILKMEGTPHQQRPSLELLASKPVCDFVEKFILDISDLYQEDSLPLLRVKESEWVLKGYHFYLKILYAWALYIQTQSRGEILMRSKEGAFAAITEDHVGSMQFKKTLDGTETAFRFDEKNATLDALFRAMMPLQNEGVSLFLDGQPIEEMSATDFVSEVVLEETSTDSTRIDWFELHPKFFFKGVEVSEQQAFRLRETGMILFEGKVYRLPEQNLPSLEKLASFWEQLSVSQAPKRGGKKTDRIFRLPKHYTLELLALRSTGVKVKGGPLWDQICEFYDSLSKGERPEAPLPKEFTGDLKPYQRTGVQWLSDLYRLGLGAILADEMGLGKTVQTLVFLEALREKNELGHSMIIVPTSLTYNWYSEASRFTPKIPLHLFQPRATEEAQIFLKENPQGLLITTYGLLTEHEEFFSQFRWTVHVFDEAQNLKTITAKRTTVSRKIPARFKVCLTGTPLENHLGEFYSLVDLVVPGSLGAFDAYRKVYMPSYSPEPERIQFLKLKTKPLVLRRTKSTILKELPSKTESTLKIPFTEKQREIYRDIALSWNTKVRKAIQETGEAKSQLIMLTALLRLRQACSSPSSIPNVKYPEIPPKISLLVDNLKEIIETGESALVFTQFLGTFDLIEKELRKAGIPVFCLHGKVSRKEREDRLQAFHQQAKGAVMLMTLKTGGVGLNLTKASYVFHLEPWWNPAVENQATDRTHRIGQTKPVQVYRYIMSESVEEKIEVLKQRKSSQFQSLFSDVEQLDEAKDASQLHLTQKDFEYLLGVI